jgi:hypothetical protein
MSAFEIINGLPNLTEANSRLARQRLLEIAAQDQEVDLCNQAMARLRPFRENASRMERT